MTPATALDTRKEAWVDTKKAAPNGEAPRVAPEGARLLARAFYRELRDGGYAHKHVLAASYELIDLVVAELREQAEQKQAAERAEAEEASERNGVEA